MTRCGFTTIIGAPNAGKSTLLNQLAGSKLAIVTPKAQTTRNRIRAICMEGDAQLIFTDTPGIFNATHAFEKAMVESAYEGMGDADAVLFLIDAEVGLNENSRRIVESFATTKPKHCYTALNKTDRASKQKLLELATELSGLFDFEGIFMISAKTADGVADLRKTLAGIMPEGPHLYPEDELTDISERLLAAEITREKLFFKLQQELPYSLHVETESWEEEGERTKIGQIIYVQREAHKKIVIGKGGAMLKEIGEQARKEMNYVLGRRVHLSLFVKVREDWKDNPESYRYLGLTYKK